MTRALLTVLLVTAVTASARAQDATPIESNDFNIDLVIGPILGPSRAVGLGGAYTALARGIDGAPWNPASYASRAPWELDWFEWELTFSFIPGAFRNEDFDNNGEAGVTYDNFFFFTPGARLQFANFGVGVILLLQNYVIDQGGAAGRTNVQVITSNYGFGHAFLDGQLVAGIGARTASLSMQGPGLAAPGITRGLVDFVGTGLEAGLLWRPTRHDWRVGVAARTPVSSRLAGGMTTDEGSRMAAGLYLPTEVHMPWEAQLGFAFQLGERPLNHRWVNPSDVERRLRARMMAQRAQRERQQVRRELRDLPPDEAEREAWQHRQPQSVRWWAAERARRAREDRALARALEKDRAQRKLQVRSLSRDYWLISTELIIIGSTDNAVGLESFLSQQRQRSGEDPSLGMRVGAETEPIAHRLKVRMGSYLEPSRFEDVGYRWHVTAGCDIRLFRWDIFGLVAPFDLRAGISADISVAGGGRYSDIGVGLGFWH